MSTQEDIKKSKLLKGIKKEILFVEPNAEIILYGRTERSTDTLEAAKILFTPKHKIY